MHRRKRENDQWIVKTAMKAVLLSPVLVLAVWSIAAITFSHKQMSTMSTPQRRYQQKKGWLGGGKRAQGVLGNEQLLYPQQQGEQFLPQGAPLIVQPAYLPKQGMTVVASFPTQGTGATQYYSFPEQGSRRRGVVALPAQGTDATNSYSFPEQDSSEQQQDYSNAENALPLPLPLAQQDLNNVYYSEGALPLPKQGTSDHTVLLPEQGTQYYYTFPEDAPAEGSAQGLVPLKKQRTTTAHYYRFPEQGAADNVVPLPGQGSEYYYKLPEQGAVGPDAEEIRIGQQPLSQGQPIKAQAQSLRGRVQPHAKNSNLRHKQQNVKYYFYDPRATVKDKHGFLHLPQIVYDTFGRAVSLNSLSAAAPVFLQPPQPDAMIHQNISSNSTVYNYTHTHPPVVETRQKRRSMSMPKLNDGWGESTAADSSLIVCTVGVMALLVGALSARRMRSRSILSSCIENESLEDDAAYDTAYTTSASNQYNTFQQGWKGDLEKFDV